MKKQTSELQKWSATFRELFAKYSPVEFNHLILILAFGYCMMTGRLFEATSIQGLKLVTGVWQWLKAR